MTDYSWIKPGVKAVLVKSEFPQFVGRVVTIESEIYQDGPGESMQAVEVVEGTAMGKEIGWPNSLVAHPTHLAPYYKPTDWNEMASKTDQLTPTEREQHIGPVRTGKTGVPA